MTGDEIKYRPCIKHLPRYVKEGSGCFPIACSPTCVSGYQN